jgi:hypothetical protein
MLISNVIGIKMKFREYKPIPFQPSIKPLFVGWVPSMAKEDLIAQGREKELPGYWLYELQFKYPGRIGRLCGFLFGMFYADKPITS